MVDSPRVTIEMVQQLAEQLQPQEQRILMGWLLEQTKRSRRDELLTLAHQRSLTDEEIEELTELAINHMPVNPRIDHSALHREDFYPDE